MSSHGVIAFVGLGSNLEDPVQHVGTAFAELDRIPGSRVTARSALYRSVAIGPAGQPDYINAVAALATDLGADDLLDVLQAIEDAHGRVRTVRWGPRTLDLDLLLYGDQQIASDRLTVPHREMHRRAFVLLPLYEIEPTLLIPGRGPLVDVLAGVDSADVVAMTPDRGS